MKQARNFFAALIVGAFILLAFGIPAISIAKAQEITPTPTSIVADVPPVVPETLPGPTSTIVDIAVQFGALIGVAGLVAAVVNILKLTPLIQNGDTGPWYAGLSLAAFALLVFFKVFRGVDALSIDKEAANFSVILIFVTGYLVQLKAGQSWHDVLKLLKIPGISTSFAPVKPETPTVNNYYANPQ